ncbi:hypothetical protein MTO96_006319 [Rhipicephalus appendiculatus]
MAATSGFYARRRDVWPSGEVLAAVEGTFVILPQAVTPHPADGDSFKTYKQGCTAVTLKTHGEADANSCEFGGGDGIENKSRKWELQSKPRSDKRDHCHRATSC